MAVRCAIWNTPAVERPTTRDGREVTSSRTGGCYFITRTAEQTLCNFDLGDKALLTTWLVEQRRAGDQCPEVTSYTLDSIKGRPRLSLSAKVERFFQYLSRKLNRLGDRLSFWPANDSPPYKDAQKLAMNYAHGSNALTKASFTRSWNFCGSKGSCGRSLGTRSH